MDQKKEIKYIIIKNISYIGTILPVVMLDDLGEVAEYDKPPVKLVNMLNKNSDSGHKYEYKEI